MDMDHPTQHLVMHDTSHHTSQPWRHYQAGIYSAHQMGSCRLSANPEDGPLRETGETWECDGLFVADASVFPTSLGINPMITVEAVAYMVADQVSQCNVL